MATKKKSVSRVKKANYGVASRILDAIRSEVQDVRGLSDTDYYAKQANPKDGGYAKSNYVKGDGFDRDISENRLININPELLAEAGVQSQVTGAIDMRLKVNNSLLKASLAEAKVRGESRKGKK